MLRVLVPAPLSDALASVKARVRDLSAVLAAAESSRARVCIVDFEHWAEASRAHLEAAVESAVARWERGELAAEAAASEIMEALSHGADESTVPARL